ncbi:class I adenylate-forming enzyme family protein [Streptomyces sp. NPDC091292]|uniref:class I adenylate-forming enzyme family protein n=1 Tax=Streptomyces sp. NPDC091292 TaxID=3365991 RepID=UPI00380FDD26
MLDQPTQETSVNITMLLEMAAEAHGDRIAVGSAHTGRELTYRELLAASREGARVLAGAGDGPRTLACLGVSGPAAVIGVFAAAGAGSTFAPLNHRLPEGSLKALAERVLPALALAGPDEWAAAESAGADPVVEEGSWLARCLADAAGGEAAEAEPPQMPVAPAVLLFTSGTSAEPKPIALHHDNLLAYVLSTVEFGSAAPDEAQLLAVPLFHIAGVASVLSCVYSGRRIVALPAFSAKGWLDTARREAVTHAFVVPTMLARIVDELAADPSLTVPSLRHLAYGGARMPLPVLENALRLFPDTDFVNAYGLTETSSTIAVLGPDTHRAAAQGDPVARERLSSVGRPVDGIEIRIVTDEGGEAGPGERGELHLRGAQIADGACTDARGWFRTGDSASLDSGGYLYVHGRRDDTIIRGGENIAPGEIEDVLLRHEGVASACVVGLADAEWGERVEAAVTPVPGHALDTEALIAWTRERVGTLKAPQRIHVMHELPLTSTGKVIRRSVGEALGAGAESAGSDGRPHGARELS